MRPKAKWLAPVLMAIGMHAPADSFRCGTRIVVTGDPIGRLVKACGQPAFKYKSRESVGKRGDSRMTAVTNWVYERGRKRNMVVSVHGGKVVRIDVE